MCSRFAVVLPVLLLAGIGAAVPTGASPYCPSECICDCYYGTSACYPCPDSPPFSCSQACTDQYSQCRAAAWTPEEIADCALERTACRAGCGSIAQSKSPADGPGGVTPTACQKPSTSTDR